MAAKTALVTGASGGIGKVIAECFARDKVDLIIVARSLASLEPLAEQWRGQFGIRVTPLAFDLARVGAAQDLAGAVAAAGLGVDYLVNNAGVGLYGEFADLGLETQLAMMTLNMTTPTVLTKLLLPGLIARRGKIMNVASTAAFQPGPYMAVYFGTKAFLLSFSEALAAELSGTGVTVTAFCPGPTQSGFQDKADMHHSKLVKGKKLPSAEAVAPLGYQALLAGKRVYVPGLMNKFLVQLVRFTPRRVVTTIAKYLTKPVASAGA